MSKTTKTLLVFLVVFISTILSLLIAVENNIDTKKIKKELESSLLKVFPQANIRLAKVDYSLGTMVRFYFNDISVQIKNKKILSLDKVVCKTSLLSTIFGGGKIQINVDHPQFSKDLINHVNNKVLSDNKINIKLPKFISQSKIDLSLRNIELSNEINKLHLKKILLKNINGPKSLVYEIISKADYNIGSQNIIADVQIIGEMKNNNKKEYKSNLMIDLKNIIIQNKTSVPRARAKVELSWNRKDKLQGQAELNLTTLGDFVFNFSSDLKNIQLSQLQGSIQNESLPNVFSDPFFKLFDYQKSLTLIKGKLSYNSKTGEVNPYLDLKLQKPIHFSLGSIDSEIDLTSKINKSDLKIKMSQHLLNGVVNSDLNLKLLQGKMKSIKGKISLTGISIQRNMINMVKDYLFKKQKVKEIEFSDEKNNQFIELDITGKNNMLGDTKFDLSGHIFKDKQKFALNKLKLITNEGFFLTNILKQDKKPYQISLKANKVQLKGLKPVLPYLLPNLAGSLSGSLDGNFSYSSYKFDVKLNLKSFIIDLVDLTSPVNSFLTKIGRDKYFTADERLNSFEKISGDFTLFEDGVFIKKATIESEKISFLNIQAKVREEQKSYVSGSLKIDKTIPFRYIGFGHVLNPDQEFLKKNVKR